jgi:hypothetical protein
MALSPAADASYRASVILTVRRSSNLAESAVAVLIVERPAAQEIKIRS